MYEISLYDINNCLLDLAIGTLTKREGVVNLITMKEALTHGIQWRKVVANNTTLQVKDNNVLREL